MKNAKFLPAGRQAKFKILTLLFVGILVVGGWWFLGAKGKQDFQSRVDEQNPVFFPALKEASFEKGKPASDVVFIDFDDKKHSLSQYKGKAVVLDFWAAWCPFCLEEMVELQKAQDKYSDRLVMVGIHRTDTEKAETGLKFAKERRVSYLLVSDPTGSLYKAAGGFGMPVAVFIDKTGIVKEIKSGPKTVEEIEEKIAALLKE